MKESYMNMKPFPPCMQYNIQCWNICGDFKVVAVNVGTQLGFTTFCCSLCEWASRAKYHGCSVKQRPWR